MRLALRGEKDLPSSQNTKLKTENCYSENKSDGLRCLSSTDSAQSYRPKERPELNFKHPTLQVYHRRPVSKSQGPERRGPNLLFPICLKGLDCCVFLKTSCFRCYRLYIHLVSFLHFFLSFYFFFLFLPSVLTAFPCLYI